jgi:hypothetical protein
VHILYVLTIERVAIEPIYEIIILGIRVSIYKEAYVLVAEGSIH